MFATESERNIKQKPQSTYWSILLKYHVWLNHNLKNKRQLSTVCAQLYKANKHRKEVECDTCGESSVLLAVTVVKCLLHCCFTKTWCHWRQLCYWPRCIPYWILTTQPSDLFDLSKCQIMWYVSPFKFCWVSTLCLGPQCPHPNQHWNKVFEGGSLYFWGHCICSTAVFLGS